MSSHPPRQSVYDTSTCSDLMSSDSMSKKHRPEAVQSAVSGEHTKLSLDRIRQLYKLYSYTVAENEGQKVRIVTWAKTHKETIQHYVPMGVEGIPYTFHSKLFPELQDMVVFRYWSSDRKPANIKHEFKFEDDDSRRSHTAEYHFPSSIESQEFQSRIRGKKLLKTFDIDFISIIQSHTLIPNTYQHYARNVTIKVWRKTDTAITFFAMLDSVKHQRHYQFYLSWFSKEADLRGERRLVLKFNHQREIEQQHVSPRKTPGKRQLSFPPLTYSKGKRPESEDHFSRKLSVPENSSLPSLRVHNSELQTDDSVEKDWEALEIQFTHEGDAEAFIKTCLDSQNESKLVAGPGPHLVSPYSKRLSEDKDLTDRSRDQRQSLPPTPPETTQPEDDVVKDQDMEEELKKRRAASQQWWKAFNDNRDQIFPVIYDSYKPVKVAIIDTGIDLSNPYIEKHWNTKKLYRDFLLDDTVASELRADLNIYSEDYVKDVLGSLQKRVDQPIDEAGHGTHLAGIVLQLTPDANLCVARVLKDNLTSYDTREAARRVALAILYAVQVWDAKVINLSIGFDAEKLAGSGEAEKKILIHALTYARAKHVVVFAAASNSANRKSLAFPASEPDHVLTMNSTNGCGGKSWFNPQGQNHHENLSILGEYIKSTWLQRDMDHKSTVTIAGAVWKRDGGTSHATTIATCVAVLILQFGRQYGVGEKLETFKGVRAVLRKMPEQRNTTSDGFYDIVPWMSVFHIPHETSEVLSDAIKSNIKDILSKAHV